MSRLTAALAALVLATGQAEAQTPPTADTLIAAEATPGTAALLVEHAMRADVQLHLARLLAHPRADVRAAAARVILAVGAGGLLPRLTSALQTEVSRDTFAELTRAVAILGGPALDESLVASWARLGPDAAPAAIAFARVRGPAALGALDAVRSLPPRAVASFVEAARPDAATLDRLLEAAVTTPAPAVFRAGLAAARAGRLQPAEARLVAGLAADRPAEMRLEAARAALTGWTGESALAPALVAALSHPAPFADDPTSLDSVVMRELADRLAGRRPSTGAAWRDQVEAPGPLLAGLLASKGVQGLLAPRELRHLQRALPHVGRGAPPDLAPAAPAAAVQLLDSYPPGFIPGVLAATGCDIGKASRQGIGAGAGELDLRADGRPSRIAPIDTGVTATGCDHATRVLLMTHVADRPPAAGPERRIAVVPFDGDYLTCRASQDEELAEAVTMGAARITPPRKTRHVNPVYPDAARRAGVEGIVVLDATIGAGGCVGRLSVVRGVDPRLDLAALLAVMRWRFSPTLVDGRPAAVVMTATVQFSLQ